MGKKKLVLGVWILVIAAVVGWGSATYALVIGVGEFDDPKIERLPGAIRDAEQLAGLFERLSLASEQEGSLELLVNPTRSQLLFAVYNWTNKGQEGDRMILYYGGHAETQVTRNGTQTYLVPRDGYSVSAMMAETCLGFQEKIEPLLEENMEGKQVLLILDACYSGSILKSRPLSQPKIELSGFEMLAQQRGIQVLVSAGENEKSQEKPGGGGYFTDALLEGLKGRANANGDETIQMGELGAFVRGEVQKTTRGEQNPVYFGSDPEMVVAQDPMRTTRELVQMVTLLFGQGQIPQEHFVEYGKILGQEAVQDTAGQQKLRKYLEQYYQNRDLETLSAMTQIALEDTTRQPDPGFPSRPVSSSTPDPVSPPQQPTPETMASPEPQPSFPSQPTQGEKTGTCILKVVVGDGSEEVQGEVHAWMDGEYIGKMGKEGLSTGNLEVGKHVL
ncbi:MAG TPA: caspase family protein, partial [Thermotogota bacterium]|nr:caspase family protein [Thermotogota bacterium]